MKRFLTLLLSFATLVSCMLPAHATGDGELTVPADMTYYEVEHYQQTVDATGYTLFETEIVEGVAGNTVTAITKGYTGFTENITHPNRVATGVVQADNSLRLALYYDRTRINVTVDPNNGETPAVHNLYYGDTIPEPDPRPTKPGYDFAGWINSADSGQSNPALFDFTMPLTGNITILGTWVVSTSTGYKVEHYQQKVDGSGYDLFETDDLTGTTGASVTATPKTYTGFHENTSYSGRKVTGTIAADGSLVLKLYYDREDYKLTIDADNGSTPTQQSVRAGGKATKPTDPKKTGYNFAGWFLSDGTPFDFNTPFSGDVSIIAHWTAKSDITYRVERYQQNVDRNGYTLFENKTFSGTTGQTVNATVEVYDGFTYSPDHPGQIASGVVAADGSLVLKLYYDRNTVTLTIDPNNGQSPSTQTLVYGAKATKPSPMPTKTGYDFDKWVTSDGDFDFNTPILRDMTIKATWKGSSNTEYKIEHYKQDKSGYVLADTETKKGTTDQTVTATPKSYTGFTEDTTNGNRVASGVVAADGSLVLKLYYKHGDVTVTFKGEDATVTKEIKVAYGSTVTKPSPDPTKPGYAFAGWIDSGKNAFDFNTPVYENITLTPSWTPSGGTKYTIEHYRQDVEGNGYTVFETETLTGVTDTTATAFAKTYTGFTENKDIKDRKATGVIAADGSLVLKLYYDRMMLEIKIDFDDGSPIETHKVRYGGYLPKPSDPEKEGFEFINWVDLKGNIFDFSKPVYGQTMLKPTWSKISEPEPAPDTGLSSTANAWLGASVISLLLAAILFVPIACDSKKREQ